MAPTEASVTTADQAVPVTAVQAVAGATAGLVEAPAGSSTNTEHFRLMGGATVAQSALGTAQT